MPIAWTSPLFRDNFVPTLEALLAHKEADVKIPDTNYAVGMALDFLSVLYRFTNPKGDYYALLAIPMLDKPANDGKPNGTYKIKFTCSRDVNFEDRAGKPAVNLFFGSHEIESKLTPMVDTQRFFVATSKWGLLRYLQFNLPSQIVRYNLRFRNRNMACEPFLRFYNSPNVASQDFDISEQMYALLNAEIRWHA